MTRSRRCPRDQWTALGSLLAAGCFVAMLGITWWSATADRASAHRQSATLAHVPAGRRAAILAPRVDPPPAAVLDTVRQTPAPQPLAPPTDAPPDTTRPLDPGPGDPLDDLDAFGDPDRAPITRQLWESATAIGGDAVRRHAATSHPNGILRGVDPSHAGCCPAITIHAVTAHVDPADHHVVQVVVIWSDATPSRTPQVREQVDVLHLHPTRRADGHVLWAVLPETPTDDS